MLARRHEAFACRESVRAFAGQLPEHPPCNSGGQGPASAGTSYQPSLDFCGLHHEAPGHHSSAQVTGSEEALDALLPVFLLILPWVGCFDDLLGLRLVDPRSSEVVPVLRPARPQGAPNTGWVKSPAVVPHPLNGSRAQLAHA
jgi:hypothetical protein